MGAHGTLPLIRGVWTFQSPCNFTEGRGPYSGALRATNRHATSQSHRDLCKMTWRNATCTIDLDRQNLRFQTWLKFRLDCEQFQSLILMSAWCPHSLGTKVGPGSPVKVEAQATNFELVKGWGNVKRIEATSREFTTAIDTFWILLRALALPFLRLW